MGQPPPSKADAVWVAAITYVDPKEGWLSVAGVLDRHSRPGNCSDNAALESFWSTLKRELVHRRDFQTRAEARAAIFEWIEVFSNRPRLHSAPGFQSPVDFENPLNSTTHASCALSQ